MKLRTYLKRGKVVIDQALDSYLPSVNTAPRIIHQAMRYSVFPGGKRFRPILCGAAAAIVGSSLEEVLPAACAIELIHTYSLIHDDLPALDDDDYRRGKLTSHRRFNEAIAILTGDALLTHAFTLIVREQRIKKEREKVITDVLRETAGAIGTLGMIGGQVMDLTLGKARISISRLESIYRRKTAALIVVSLKIGALLGGMSPASLKALCGYGGKMGLAFQIVDDIHDFRAGENKISYPALLGATQSRKRARELVREAKVSLSCFGKRGEILRQLADYVVGKD